MKNIQNNIELRLIAMSWILNKDSNTVIFYHPQTSHGTVIHLKMNYPMYPYNHDENEQSEHCKSLILMIINSF